MNLNVFESVAISGATLDAARQRNPDEEEEKEPEFDDVYELGEKVSGFFKERKRLLHLRICFRFLQ